MSTRRILRVLAGLSFLLLMCLVAPFALAQDAPEADTASRMEEGELLVDVLNEYVSAYRPDTWVPVDIIVRNNRRNISGWLEVRTEAFGQEQETVYRVPVESPKGSRKRFRVCCRLRESTELDIMLYDGKKAALDVPFRMRFSAIAPEAFLYLVMDEEPLDYGFLYSIVHGEDQILTDKRGGVHSIKLSADALEFLPDRPQCYEPLDLIIMGDIDPTRVSERHRRLLEQYVIKGGVLVICTGENGDMYRGVPWIENLAGVTFGHVRTVDEAALAESFFSPEKRVGARPGWECVFTELAPREVGVEVFQYATPQLERPVLATRRTVGSGYVVVIAVDAASRALQECPGYRAFWRDLCRAKHREEELNLPAAAQYCADALVSVVGIRVYPKSAILGFLALYFVVAIVANWLFWNYFKRREMAWVCLVLFSIGFTLYAVIVGTAGRAKTAELEEMRVLRLPAAAELEPVLPGVSWGSVDAVIGLLTTRTSRFSFDLSHDNALVADLGYRASVYDYVGRRGFGGGLGFGGVKRFYSIQSSPPRVEDFAVGASEIRLLCAEAEVPLPGNIGGSLTYGDPGLHGKLINHTGLRLLDPFVLFEGRVYPVVPMSSGDGQSDGWEIEVPSNPAEQLRAAVARAQQYAEQFMRHRYYYGNYGRLDMASFREAFLAYLLSLRGQSQGLDPNLGPFLIGWAQPTGGAATESIVARESLGEGWEGRVSATLLVADIRVERADRTQRWLPVTAQAKQLRGGAWGEGAYRLSHFPLPVHIALPEDLPAGGQGDVLVSLYVGGRDADQPILCPHGDEDTWPGWELVDMSKEVMWGEETVKRTYRISNWQAYCRHCMQTMPAMDRPQLALLLCVDPPAPNMYSQGGSSETVFKLQARFETDSEHQEEAVGEQGGQWYPWP